MTVILSPGIHDGIEAADYHSDPCPEPSLSGSIAIPLVHRSPRHAWHKHPRLNPSAEQDQSNRLDLGSVAHELLLGTGGGVAVIAADDYRSKDAREQRDAARAVGKTPVLGHVHVQAIAMADAARSFLDAALPQWRNGKPEQVLIWREGDAWCRGMVDWLTDDCRTVIDYKTTSSSARPEDAERSLFDLNYHLKAAFYERGLDVLMPDGTGRRRFLFLFQETEAPFECSLIAMSEGAMTIGRKQATYAIRRWRQCMTSNDWPGYGIAAHSAVAPSWIEQRWLARELVDPFATGETAPGETMPVYPIHGKAGF